MELITSTILKAAHEMSYPSICSFRERKEGGREGGRGKGGRRERGTEGSREKKEGREREIEGKRGRERERLR